MQNLPLVTVLIPTYNCAAYIGTAIESALAQTYPAVEIIVIDDGSTDNTDTILAHYQNKIKIIRQANKGPSAARNAGLASAKGKYIATLDADDSWLPQRLELAVNFLENTAHDIVLTNFYLMSETGQRLKTYFNLNFSAPKNQYQALLRSPLPFTMMVCKTELMKALSYDETLPFAEDYDLYLRALQNDAFWGYISEPLAGYRVRLNSLSHSYNRDHKQVLWRIFNKQKPALGKFKTFLFYQYQLGLYRWYCLDSALKSKKTASIIKQGIIAIQSAWFIVFALPVLLRRLLKKNYMR